MRCDVFSCSFTRQESEHHLLSFAQPYYDYCPPVERCFLMLGVVVVDFVVHSFAHCKNVFLRATFSLVNISFFAFQVCRVVLTFNTANGRVALK